MLFYSKPESEYKTCREISYNGAEKHTHMHFRDKRESSTGENVVTVETFTLYIFSKMPIMKFDYILFSRFW